MTQYLADKNIEHQRWPGLQSLVSELAERVERLEAARPPPNKLLSQEAAAELIGVKPPTLAAWRHYGKGPAYLKAGRSAFFRIEAIEEWIDTQAVVPVPKEAA
jgi:Helix-turn-helix domain